MKKILIFVTMILINVSNVHAQSHMKENKMIKINIIVRSKTLSAELYNNVTTQALLQKMPFTVKMSDLYNREMCYNFSEALPTENVEYTGYNVGEIIYWPPRNSFVIMYKQNGEKFNMQKVGHISTGVEIFQNTGDIEVTFDKQ